MTASRQPRARKFIYAALYFSEGAPIGFLWWALPTHLRAAGVSVGSITSFTSLLVLPWALKFLWAPAVDALRTARFGLRGWIIGAQIVMGLALLPLLFLDLGADLTTVYGLLVAHALAAATQDVAVDALCMESIAQDERGSVNGWMQAGMLLGRAVFGGGFLLLESHIGFRGGVLALIGAIWITLAVLLAWVPAPAVRPRSPGALRAALLAALGSRTVWMALLFAATGGAAYEGVAAVAGPYLVDAHAGSAAIGLFFAGPVIIAMVIGALVAGWYADRGGAFRAVLATQVGIVAVVAVLAAVHASVGGSAEFGFGALGVLYLGIGGFTAASYTLLMRIADGPAKATLFSAFMGMTNLCELWSARAVGAAHGVGGYAPAFALVAGASVVALVPLFVLTRPD